MGHFPTISHGFSQQESSQCWVFQFIHDHHVCAVDIPGLFMTIMAMTCQSFKLVDSHVNIAGAHSCLSPSSLIRLQLPTELMSEPSGVGLSTPEGLQLAQKLLWPQLPHNIHDYVLEGICKAVDGTDILAVTKTRGSKSWYFYGYLLLLQALQDLSPPYTLAAVHHADWNLWKECIEDVSIVLLSPEQLLSRPFDRLLQNQAFTSWLCTLGIDKVYLVHDWGDQSFCKSFCHITLVHACMSCHTALIAVTATLLAGDETKELLAILGLKPDLPNVADAVELGGDHPNHGKQCKGHMGRFGGDVKDPCGITYVTKAMLNKAKKMVQKHPSESGGKCIDGGLHISMAQLLTTSCYCKQENILYDNPKDKTPCSCETCTKISPPNTTQCTCSNCCPEPILPSLLCTKATYTTIPMALQLMDEMKKHGHQQLELFCQDLWKENHHKIGHSHPFTFLPNNYVKLLLENFAHLEALSDLDL
ncbi:hypothetical protein BDQ12DRAFT_668286 [Crucibulum laeve]|uniref:Uncharacterized protein n=1 Tax=Crucibulum laeve TaxID=68775 RepID=A0A5C3LRV8_9AGAR|nr:hypothetical protein BDQ12DRAFT_668286 [Crucibulum laeve]